MQHRTACIAVAAVGLALIAPASAGAATPSGLTAECSFSHRAFNDPIVHHGHPGMSHSHDFFGNKSTNARSTPRKLRRRGTTCRPRGDRSAYWVPTLRNDGRTVRPLNARFYYVVMAEDPTLVKPHPRGLRVIAGDQNGLDAMDTPRFAWTCTGSTALHTASIPRCERGSRLVLRLGFPDCWDGRRLDSADHQEHMAYGSDGRCPESHPVPVPQLRFRIRYATRGGDQAQLASGPPWTTHGDFMNGWRQRAYQRRLNRCIHLTGDCLSASPGDESY